MTDDGGGDDVHNVDDDDDEDDSAGDGDGCMFLDSFKKPSMMIGAKPRNCS